MNYSVAELMAVVLSRRLREGDVMVTGTNAGITCSAALVARACGRPRVRTIIGAFGTVDPTVELVPASGADQSFLPGRVVTDLISTLGDQVRGLADVICLGGLQVDRDGRVNLAVVGDYSRPDLRGPGTIGVSLIARLERTFLYFTEHDPRTFVERVDFVGAQGLRPGGRGLEVIVTPMAVLGPVEDGSRIDLVSIHAGFDFEQVQARTGFALDPSRAVVTEPPSEEELAALRGHPYGMSLATMTLG
ncbi:MAG TPA: CoA-transferase [Solirubrobacterales bacterium]|nr:CoA-transferase [Solirubrobacterales bacterium]